MIAEWLARRSSGVTIREYFYEKSNNKYERSSLELAMRFKKLHCV